MDPEPALSPGGPGGGTPGSAVPFVGRDGRVRVSLSPPRVVPPALGTPGWAAAPTTTNTTTSPSPSPVGFATAGEPQTPPQHYAFTGRVLEERAEEASNSLLKTVSLMGRGSAAAAAVLRSGSPMKELEEGDLRAEEQRKGLVEDKVEQLARDSEEVCRSELETHFKLLRLRNAASMVPELLRKNKHLQDELVRARSARPDELRHTLEEIDAKLSRIQGEAADRATEEARQKERLREALSALKEGGFAEDEMITFMTAALDSALGVVFRVEEERSYLAGDIATQAEEIQRLADSNAEAAQKVGDLQAQLVSLTSEKTSQELQGAELESQVKELQAQLEGAQSELEAERSFSHGLKEKIFEMDEDTIRRERQLADQRRETEEERARAERQAAQHDDAAERVRQRFQKQLDQLENEMSDGRAAMDERLKRERVHTAEMEQRWKQAEEQRLEEQKRALVRQADVQVLEEKIGVFSRSIEQSAVDLSEERAAVASAKSELRSAQQRATASDEEKAELQQVLDATIDALDAEKKINRNLRNESQRLTESCVGMQDSLMAKTTELQEVEHVKSQALKEAEVLRAELEETIEAKRAARANVEELLDQVRVCGEEASMTTAAQRCLEEEKAVYLKEHEERQQKLDTVVAALAEAQAECERMEQRLEALAGAEEKLAEAERLSAEADELRTKAEAAASQNKKNAEDLAKVSSDFEQSLTRQTQKQLRDKNEQLERCKTLLREERDRNERAEERLHQCVDQLKYVEAQRVRDAQQHRGMEEQLEERAKGLEARLHDARLDTRCVKKNAKTVGWILAGRGALLRDLYKLHNVLLSAPARHPSAPAAVARDLSSHILETHLFECERRHLGMGPMDRDSYPGQQQLRSLSADSPTQQEVSPPRMPSPRESQRLLNHSPAARYQDRPSSTEYPLPLPVATPHSTFASPPPVHGAHPLPPNTGLSQTSSVSSIPAGLAGATAPHKTTPVSSVTAAALERYREERRARRGSPSGISGASSSAGSAIPRMPSHTNVAAHVSGPLGTAAAQAPVSTQQPVQPDPLPLHTPDEAPEAAQAAPAPVASETPELKPPAAPAVPDAPVPTEGVPPSDTTDAAPLQASMASTVPYSQEGAEADAGRVSPVVQQQADGAAPHPSLPGGEEGAGAVAPSLGGSAGGHASDAGGSGDEEVGPALLN